MMFYILSNVSEVGRQGVVDEHGGGGGIVATSPGSMRRLAASLRALGERVPDDERLRLDDCRGHRAVRDALQDGDLAIAAMLLELVQSAREVSRWVDAGADSFELLDITFARSAAS